MKEEKRGAMRRVDVNDERENEIGRKKMKQYMRRKKKRMKKVMKVYSLSVHVRRYFF